MWFVCDVLYVVLYVCVNFFVVRGCAVVVRLSVHVHFILGLSPRDCRVPGQRLSVCSIGLMVSV